MHRTHRLPEGPQQTLAKTFNQGGRSAEELAAEGVSLAHTSMPNHFKAAMPAGTAMFFDTSIWHTGMPVSAAAPFASSFEEAQDSCCTAHCFPFRKMMTHPGIMQRLQWMLGAGFRCSNNGGMLASAVCFLAPCSPARPPPPAAPWCLRAGWQPRPVHALRQHQPDGRGPCVGILPVSAAVSLTSMDALPPDTFRMQNGRVLMSTSVNVEWVLTDSPAGAGGL